MEYSCSDTNPFFLDPVKGVIDNFVSKLLYLFCFTLEPSSREPRGNIAYYTKLWSTLFEKSRADIRKGKRSGGLKPGTPAFAPLDEGFEICSTKSSSSAATSKP